MSIGEWVNRHLGRDLEIDPMVELQYQTMVGTAQQSLPRDVVERPDLVTARAEFRKIEAIEAELINQVNDAVAQQLLDPYFTRPDPWLRARAAKALYRLNPRRALEQLSYLATHSSQQCQMPAVWALGEIASGRSLELLMPMAWSRHPVVQYAVLRCLLQVESHRQVPATLQTKFSQLLADLRTKSGWIL